MKKGLLPLAVTMIGTLLATPAHAQPASSPATPVKGEVPDLRAVAVVAPPFVMEQNGSLTGFSIELWEAIAARLKRKTSYQLEPDIGALEETMRSKRADLTVVPVFATSAREEEFDFSFPIMEAGLQVMVRDIHQKTRADNPLWDMLRLLLSRTTASWLGMALLLVLIPAHVVWLLERRHADGMISSRKYFPGILEATYWALSTLTTQAETMPRQWLARGLSILWMFAGVIFVASYTAQLTTTLTVEQIRGAIEGPDDLPGKQVATIARSLAVDYLREHHALVQEFPTTDQAFKALLDQKVDAVLTAAPILRYYAAHEGKRQVKLVGPEINIAPVALMEQLNSPLRKRIDGALLRLREDGSYQKIYDKWFGSPE
jgi:polar amino acid transport system substrate-binding protein